MLTLAVQARRRQQRERVPPADAAALGRTFRRPAAHARRQLGSAAASSRADLEESCRLGRELSRLCT